MASSHNTANTKATVAGNEGLAARTIAKKKRQTNSCLYDSYWSGKIHKNQNNSFSPNCMVLAGETKPAEPKLESFTFT